MGAQLSTVAPTAMVPIDAYVAELGDLTYSSDLGRSRFLKTVRATHREGLAVVKVFIKPTSGQISLDPFKQQMQHISDSLRQDLGPLNEFPNAIGYSRIVETERAGYLVRQYIKHNLYDRISTRPFLEPIEKKWIAYQLLRALKSCHEREIYHGDIKSENVLVGSWKWIYLADFAPFKPVKLPETDTAQFLFYFDVSQRRVCYVAPERFSDTGPSQLTGSMDIYSTGCVIAELFMDGQPLFSLADLFKYKRGEWSPDLSAISEDELVQQLVLSMVSVDPQQRKGASEYLDMYRGTLFPEYFDTFWELLAPQSSSVGATSSNGMVEHLWRQFEPDVLVKSLGVSVEASAVTALPATTLPAVVPLPGAWIVPKHRPTEDIPGDCGALIVLSYVCSSLTSTSSVEWRLKAAQLVLALAEYVPDDAKLDRCLPYLVLLLRDTQPMIRASALALVAHLVSMVRSYSPLNVKVYTAYLFPRISQAVNSQSPPEVRAMLANCLPQLAESAVECEGWEAVVGFVDETTRLLLVDKVGIVRRSLLNNADVLCSVLRKQGTNDIILLHAITYLNDKDPYVRMDLFRFIAKVAPLVGVATIEQYVAPLMIQSLCDPREDIVALIIQSLASMIEVGLIRLKTLLSSVTPACVKFLIHPNVYIRTQTLILVANAARQLSQAQVYCLLRPQIAPYLIGDVSDYGDYGALSEALRPPITQPVFSLVLRWAANVTKTRFWSPAGADASSTVTFSQEDRRWLSSLREIGFNNEDLWQLLVFREFLWQLSRMPSPVMPPPSELEPPAENGKADSPDSPDAGQPRVQSVTLPNGSNRLTSKRALASWTEGSPIPHSLKAYIESHKAATDTQQITDAHTLVVIGSKKISKTSLMVPTNINSASSHFTDSATPTSTSSLPSIKKQAGAIDRQLPTTLVSSMKAHRGAINVLISHPNNRHFVTAADDGLIKLWDVRLLLKGSSKPVSTYEAGSSVTACTFLGDTSILAYSTENSEVGFLKYSFKVNEIGNLLFEGSCKVGDYSMPSGKAVSFHCSDSAGVSPLVDTFNGTVSTIWILNSEGKILKVELGSLTLVQTLEWPQEHGPPTSWVWDGVGDWVVISTLHGMLELFDMRFSLHVNSWGIGDLRPITAMDAHPSKEKLLCVAGGFKRNLVSVWDIEKVECRELLVPVSDLEDIDNDSELPSLDPIMATQPTLSERFAAWNIKDNIARPRPPVTAMASTKRPGSHRLLTGGGDRILRFWDLRSPYQSVAISGLNYTKGKLSYMGKVGSSIKYTYESWNPTKGAERLPRTAVISNEEQDIGRNHRGSITKVGLLEQSNGRDVSVSVDEIGMIKVFA